MDHSELQQSLESRRLELAYEKLCREVDAVFEAEKFRQLRVQILLLEDDKDDLQAQLDQSDDRIADLEKQNQGFQEDLDACERKLRSAQGDLRIKTREIETLKAELTSLHGVTMDSTKILTEKLTLARELSSLKPEVDHLRSQVASHQKLLAEKLSLQRLLSTVQVELETEKRATQRALAKEGKCQAQDEKLKTSVEALQADLAKEHRERQRIEREASKVSTELENKNAALESRLDALRSKLKTTKEQLKESQAALQEAEASAKPAPSRATAPVKQGPSLAKYPRKRLAVEMDADTMIGTPGGPPAAKRNKRASTLPGEKSTFSITPFLSRTASVAPESPASDHAGRDGDGNDDPADSPSAKSKPRVSLAAISEQMEKRKRTKPVVQAKKPGILEVAKAGRANSRPPRTRKTKASSTLEQVGEEENDESSGSTVAVAAAPPPKPTVSKSIPNDTINEGTEMKMKKKKLLGGGVLGKTLFDEDDGDALNGDKGLLGRVKGFGTFARGGFGGVKIGPRKALGASSSGFGAISPLKKDRRPA